MTDELKRAISETIVEEDKKVLNNRYENGMRKLSDEEIEGIAGGVVDGDLLQDEEDNEWY